MCSPTLGSVSQLSSLGSLQFEYNSQDKKRVSRTFFTHLCCLKQCISHRNVTSLDLSSPKAELQLRGGQEKQNKEENRAILKAGAQKEERGTGRVTACSGTCLQLPASTALPTPLCLGLDPAALGRAMEGTVTGTLE